MRVIYNEEEQKIPIKLWLEDIEDGAMNQIINLSNLPFAFKHIAVMPDSHQGYGMPIGGVLATKGVVIPNAVGVDIGCGMCAVKTSLKAEQLDKETIKRILGGSKEYKGGIRGCVPVGFSHQSKKQDIILMPNADYISTKDSIIHKEFDSALKQLGTLGGGNHFIEIQKDTEDNIWIMIHSGSRNLGYKVAKYYNELAIELNSKWHSNVPSKWELAFLPLNSEEGQNYLKEMQYCVDFALANRRLMMDRIVSCFIEVIQKDFWLLNNKDEVVDLDNSMINIAHNYARMEHHFGTNVMIHRKGATSAKIDEVGIIPGSQGTKSYIVNGLGNPDSFMSCSHGAGRVMGRKEAIRKLNLDEEIKRLDEQGIIHGIRNASDLDEASGAYKNIDVVMNNQKDLVKIITELSPIAVVKG